MMEDGRRIAEERVRVTVEVPSEFVPLVGVSEEALSTEIEKLMALELVRRGALSYTRAAELLGMSQADFIAYLSTHQVSVFRFAPDELRQEVGPRIGRIGTNGTGGLAGPMDAGLGEAVLEIAAEALLALKMPLDEAGDAVRMAAAVKLFELGRLSSGAAAKLAGVPRVVFLSRLADYGVDTFQFTEEELTRETQLA